MFSLINTIEKMKKLKLKYKRISYNGWIEFDNLTLRAVCNKNNFIDYVVNIEQFTINVEIHEKQHSYHTLINLNKGSKYKIVIFGGGRTQETEISNKNLLYLRSLLKSYYKGVIGL